MKHVAALLSAAVLAASALPAAAATLVDTGTQVGNNGGGGTLGTGNYLAGRFSLASAANIGSIHAFIASYNVPNTIRVNLRSDAAGSPGGALFTSQFDTFAGASNGMWQGLGGLDWALSAGTYWVSLENLTGGAAYTPYHVPNPLGAYAFSPDAGASWTPQRSLFGLRIEDAPAAVPEPATWALMILGLGLTAAAMRRSRRQAFPSLHPA